MEFCPPSRPYTDIARIRDQLTNTFVSIACQLTEQLIDHAASAGGGGQGGPTQRVVCPLLTILRFDSYKLP